MKVRFDMTENQSMTAAREMLSNAADFIGNRFSQGYNKSLSIGTAASLAIGGAGLAIETDGASASGAPLHSARYLRSHCHVVADVNIFAPGGKETKKDGIILKGREIRGQTPENPTPLPIAKYNWQLSKTLELCGIVGEYPQPDGPAKDISLRPTTQTAHNGEYTD